MLETHGYLTYFVYVFTSVFVITNPIGATMVFVTLTHGYSQNEKAKTCLRTTIVAFLIALLFAVGGDLILRIFGITVDSLRVAGGVLLFLLAMDMLRARPNPKVTEAEIIDANARDDVSIFPLAMPLLTGPGVITTVVVLMGASSSVSAKATVLLAIAASFAASYAILRSSELIDRLLGLTGIMVMSRIMGLVLGAIAVDFVSQGAWNLYLMLVESGTI
ncbi:MAG: hypothetical protein A4E45_00980 [Methanosaeta sp. PtaB.Bin039]|nr:MAG: hypothetical protein A4E45_00980 [Methanosaeta sp. PtaB.Bin039]OPY45081.1 MAG: hypothetical protein A4E47_01203 [Methanosaeta sp. PtaU1.Bin028]HOT06682.1 NAAT family transporter [Methanotrichaceae archaeon]HQF16710.1 NAAT family transporter [Methanotrichaceae archaeon]HQI91278.1 NAAT family transporter [Methanotrichaceae archaeon]